MLKECKQLVPRMPWRKAIPYFEGDVRLEAIQERDREFLYDDFIYDLERQEQERVRQSRKDSMRKFRQKLEEDRSIVVTAQWRKVKEQFQEDPAFTSLEKFDRLAVFEEYIRELEKQEEESKRVELHQLKKTSRLSREAFRALLNEKYQLGALTVRSKWKEFLKVIRDDERYKSMIVPQQLGSLPSEMFGDFMDDLEDRYHNEKKKVKEILKEIGFVVRAQTTFDDFLKAISSSPKFESISIRNHKLLFEGLLDKVEREEKRNQKDAERKKKKIANRFFELLETSRKLTAFSKWAEVRDSFATSSAFLKVPTEEERERLFVEFMTKKKEEMSSSDEEGRIRSESPDDKKRKHKKKHKHHKRKHSHSGESSPESKPKKLKNNADTSEEEGETHE